MFRREWLMWSALAVGVVAGCGGGESTGSGGAGGGSLVFRELVEHGQRRRGGCLRRREGGWVRGLRRWQRQRRRWLLEGLRDREGYTCSGAPSTCVTACGDGIVAGAETCDDGNTGGRRRLRRDVRDRGRLRVRR